MRAFNSASAWLLAFMGLFFVAAVNAAVPDNSDVPVNDARAVQTVVRAQLAAFAADDAERAFSYAAPSIKDMFGTPVQFMEMVRTAYPVVYRPASVTFLKPKPSDGLVVQPVHMTDGRGGSWLAMYSLQRQSDRSWRISGCVLVANSGQSI